MEMDQTNLPRIICMNSFFLRQLALCIDNKNIGRQWDEWILHGYHVFVQNWYVSIEFGLASAKWGYKIKRTIEYKQDGGLPVSNWYDRIDIQLTFVVVVVVGSVIHDLSYADIAVVHVNFSFTSVLLNIVGRGHKSCHACIAYDYSTMFMATDFKSQFTTSNSHGNQLSTWLKVLTHGILYTIARINGYFIREIARIWSSVLKPFWMNDRVFIDGKYLDKENIFLPFYILSKIQILCYRNKCPHRVSQIGWIIRDPRMQFSIPYKSTM